MRTGLLHTFFWVIVLALFGCKDAVKSSNKTNDLSDLESYEFFGEGWTPEKAILRCAVVEGCPSQVGLLIFVFPEQADGRIPIRRCTAFLTSANQITSNGHCDNTKNAQGYFVTASTSPVGKQVHKVARVLYKRHTPGPDPRVDNGRPDVGVYELETSVDPLIRPVKYAFIGQPSYNKLIGFVINQGLKMEDFVIEKIECRIRRHEAIFPYDIDENPDMITGFGCSSISGNSGGPLFAPGQEAVQAILQAGSDVAQVSQNVRSKFRRDLFSYEKHSTVTATNLRCIGPQTNRCVVADRNQMTDRFHNLQMKAAASLNARIPRSGGSDGVAYRAIPFQLQLDDREDLTFEIFYQPVCRRNENALATLNFPAELVRISLNEWGEARVEHVDMRVASAEVLRVVLNRHDVRMNWTPPFGSLISAASHPRRTWGQAFSIDIPLCPR